MPPPALLVVIPLLAAAFLAGFRKLLPRWSADLISILASLADLIVAGAWALHSTHQTQVYWFGNWFPRGTMALGIGFVMDGLGCGLAMLAALLSTLALLFSWKYVESGGNHYHPLMLVFLAAMSGFSLTGDLFNLFVFFELMSTAAFALCGLKTADPAPLAGAFNFAITNTVAGFMMLIGIALIYAVTGALNFAQIGELLAGRHDRLVLAAFIFLTTGFLTKAASVPLHFWLPDAHAVSPTPVCVLFSGLMVQLGLFGIMRLYSVIFHNCFAGTGVHLLFVVIGTITAIWGAIMCFAEHHLKRLLAFSTISHTGLMTLAFGLWTKESLTGLFLYLTGHAFVKSCLFFLAGILLHRFKSLSEPILFGKGRVLRWTAALWFLGGLGLAGTSGFALATGESRITEHAQWTEAVCTFAGVITGAAVLRAGFRIFLQWGDAGPKDKSADIPETPEINGENRIINWFLFLPTALCLAGSIILTFCRPITAAIFSAAIRFMDFRSYAHAVYATATPLPLLSAPRLNLESVLLSGCLRASLAIVVALWAVFHLRFPRTLRWPSHLEGSMRSIRALQSGHVGDYVAWLAVGCALIGAAVFWLGI